MRRNVIEAADLLDEIFEKIPNMTDDPGRQFEMLFRENPDRFLAVHKRLEIEINTLYAERRAKRMLLEDLCDVLNIHVMGARLLHDDDYVAEVEAKVQRRLKMSRKDIRRMISEGQGKGFTEGGLNR